MESLSLINCSGTVVRIERSEYRALVWKTEGRKPVGRPRHRWEDDTKMNLRCVR
jgi:hypothetical protein